jgi:NAD(P)H-dependent flavin oxidoreductase YrpB (nitropropane dioxygenase family)
VRLAARGPRQNVTEKGRVTVDGARVEIVFTSVEAPSGYDLDHFHCRIRSAWALDCVNKDSAGKVSEPFALERVEDAPPRLDSNTALCTRPTT